MKKMDKKRQKMKIRLIKSLVLVVAFVVAIGATFGITMAYFGGVASPASGTMTLKTGIWINATSPTTVSQGTYVVPSQVVKSKCEVSIKSSKEADDDALTTDQASSALLKATISVTSTEITSITSAGSKDYFDVTLKGGSTAVARLVRDKSVTDANVYYLVGATETALSDSTTMFEVVTKNGEVSYAFEIEIKIPSELGNTAGGAQITVSVSYQAVQAEFYDTDGTKLDMNVKNAKDIFGHTSTQGGATY